MRLVRFGTQSWAGVRSQRHGDPYLAPYYPPGQNSKQHYVHLDFGWLVSPPSLTNNGCQRFPAKCLVSLPMKPVELTVAERKDVQKAGEACYASWQGGGFIVDCCLASLCSCCTVATQLLDSN